MLLPQTSRLYQFTIKSVRILCYSFYCQQPTNSSSIFSPAWLSTASSEFPKSDRTNLNYPEMSMHFACWITKGTNITLEYARLLAFPLQNGCKNELQCYITRRMPVLSF